VRSVVELLNVQCVAFELDDGSFVVVDIAVVGGGENGDDHWEFCGPIPLVHLVAIELSLMGPQN